MPPRAAASRLAHTGGMSLPRFVVDAPPPAAEGLLVALGDEHRQRILLLFDKGERLNVGQIAEVSTLSRSTVSHHLKILREAEVLASEKLGKEVWFWINRDYLEEVFGNVLDYVRDSA